jgi:hypothetical protein
MKPRTVNGARHLAVESGPGVRVLRVDDQLRLPGT